MKFTFNIENSSYKLLYLLCFTDLTFIIIHIFAINFDLSCLFYIDCESGYGEVFQYTKYYWVVLLLIIMAKKKANLIYIAWAILFTYLLLDDSLRIHENVGGYLVNYYHIQSNLLDLRAQDIGEVIVSALSSLLLFLFIGWGYLVSDKATKRISKHLFILVLFLAFFGVFVDTAVMFAYKSFSFWVDQFWGLIEDGGEMLAMSIIVWYVFNLNFSSTKSMVDNV